ncbi:F0F1 ATP synthase subunit epsilon [Marinilabilia sp.]|jgi:F-type H+-transporting ATPase subunit epsilon
MEDLYLEIITPEEILYDGPVGLVEVPGAQGRFVLLRDHAPIISTLVRGDVRVIGKDGYDHHFKCKEGVLECHENHTVILMNKWVDENDADL